MRTKIACLETKKSKVPQAEKLDEDWLLGLETFAERTRSFRQRLELTQEQLAELIGCTNRQVQNYESGESTVPKTKIRDLTKRLKPIGGTERFVKAWIYGVPGTGRQTRTQDSPNSAAVSTGKCWSRALDQMNRLLSEAEVWVEATRGEDLLKRFQLLEKNLLALQEKFVPADSIPTLKRIARLPRRRKEAAEIVRRIREEEVADREGLDLHSQLFEIYRDIQSTEKIIAGFNDLQPFRSRFVAIRSKVLERLKRSLGA